MAVGTGIIVLLGYFVQIDQIPADSLLGSIFELRLLIMGWAVLLAAVALGIGLFNLLLVHWTKVNGQDPGWKYSGVLILAFMLTLILGLALGPDSPVVLFLFNSIQLPVETSLMALLAITLTLAGFRLVAQRRDRVDRFRPRHIIYGGFVLQFLRWSKKLAGAGGCRWRRARHSPWSSLGVYRDGSPSFTGC